MDLFHWIEINASVKHGRGASGNPMYPFNPHLTTCTLLTHILAKMGNALKTGGGRKRIKQNVPSFCEMGIALKFLKMTPKPV